MSINLNSGITNFFSIFNTIYQWLSDLEFTIGTITFSFIDLMISIIFVDIVIWALFRVLRGDY